MELLYEIGSGLWQIISYAWIGMVTGFVFFSWVSQKEREASKGSNIQRMEQTEDTITSLYQATGDIHIAIECCQTEIEKLEARILQLESIPKKAPIRKTKKRAIDVQ